METWLLRVPVQVHKYAGNRSPNIISGILFRTWHFHDWVVASSGIGSRLTERRAS